MQCNKHLQNPMTGISAGSQFQQPTLTFVKQNHPCNRGTTIGNNYPIRKYPQIYKNKFIF